MSDWKIPCHQSPTRTQAPHRVRFNTFFIHLYTSDCPINAHSSCQLVKFADDSELMGRINNDCDEEYHHAIQQFVDWCDENYLHLNVSKTREMCIDFRKNKREPKPVFIKNEQVERVDTYKYLGLTFDSKLNWNDHVNTLVKKVNCRLYCLRKLKSFGVCPSLLLIFYNAVICSVVTFGAVCWGGNISSHDQGRLEKLVRKASRVVGLPLDTFERLCDKRRSRKIETILSDVTHPLRQEFVSRHNPRSGRYVQPRATTKRYGNSFVPTALRILNARHRRLWYSFLKTVITRLQRGSLALVSPTLLCSLPISG